MQRSVTSISRISSTLIRSPLKPRLLPPLRRIHVQRTPPPPSPELALLLGGYRDRPFRPLPLSTLTSFGDNLSADSVVASASLVLGELPRRLAHRVRAMDSLPFIVGTNPFIASVHESYRKSFEIIAQHPSVNDLDSNWTFAMTLESLVENHSEDIPIMARGFQECSKYMSQEAISTFLDEAIRGRIALRLIAEQHIALTRHLRTPSFPSASGHKKDVGIIHKNTSPAEMVKMCAAFVSDLCEATFGTAPRLVMEGKLDATFPYVPVHLEYILTEILKNSFRATVDHHGHHVSRESLPPVVVTIAPSNSHSTSTHPSYMSLRVRDQGGGISPKNIKNIFSYAFTTAGDKSLNQWEDAEMGGGPYAAQHVGGSAAMSLGDGDDGSNLFGELTGKGLQTGLGTIAGLGYGLPLARLYAGYFGAGSGLELVSLYEYGTDVFIKLRCLDSSAGGGEEVMI